MLRLTSEMQPTVAPLNSDWSNFSTAEVRSAAVSYSTKLDSCQSMKEWCDSSEAGENLPFTSATAIAFASDFAIDNVKSRLAGKILEILNGRM